MTKALQLHNASARAASFFLAAVASTAILGATVLGMQPRSDADAQVVVMDTVTVTATKVN